MSFNVYGRDKETGKLSTVDIKNMKGEELLNQLTPQKKFDKLKDIEEVSKGYGPAVTDFDKKTNQDITGVPDLDNKIKNSVNLLFQDEAKLKKYAKAYGINKDVKDLTQEEKTAVANQYSKDLHNNFNTGKRPNMVLRDQALQEENDRLKKLKAASDDKTPNNESIDVSVQVGKTDEITGQEMKPGTLKLTHRPGPKSNVIRVTFDPVTKSYNLYEQNLKSNALTQVGKDKLKRNQNLVEGKKAEEFDPNLDYINPENSARVINSKKNSGDFNQSVLSLKKLNSKENYGSADEFYRENSPAVKTAYQAVLKEKRRQAATNTAAKTKNTSTAKSQAKTSKKKETPAERATRIANQA
jgi:hypothetical protein